MCTYDEEVNSKSIETVQWVNLEGHSSQMAGTNECPFGISMQEHFDWAKLLLDTLLFSFAPSLALWCPLLSFFCPMKTSLDFLRNCRRSSFSQKLLEIAFLPRRHFIKVERKKKMREKCWTIQNDPIYRYCRWWK